MQNLKGAALLLILPAIFLMALSAYCFMKIVTYLVNKRSDRDEAKMQRVYGDDFDEAFNS